MKNIGLLLATLLASTMALSAQEVKIQVLLDQTEFIVGEPIPVAVRVINHSGQTIHFGDENWVSYSIEALDGYVPIKSGEGAMAHGFDVETSKMATQHSDLQPFFAVTKGGRYKVTATVRIKDWEKEFTSEPQAFDIIHGTKMWEQDFGLPQTNVASKEAPETRKYSLQRATYLKHVRLYLRVTDSSEAKVFRVNPLGPIVSFANPRTQLDSKNNLHLLYEDGARSFSYVVANPDGDLLVRQTYAYTETPPRLSLNDAGFVSVTGGLRHPTSNDLPAPQPETASHDVPPPKAP